MDPSGRALFRWSGRALVGGGEREWSLILKAWRRDPRTDATEQWTYWKREFLAYSSGILDELPGISAPRFFGATDEGDVAFVWLEEIAEAGDHRWPTERYVTAGLHLGRFNGTYFAGWPIPEAPFLSRDQLRSWTNWIPWGDVVRAPGSLSHPLVATALPNPPIERLEHLYSIRRSAFSSTASIVSRRRSRISTPGDRTSFQREAPTARSGRSRSTGHRLERRPRVRRSRSSSAEATSGSTPNQTSSPR